MSGLAGTVEVWAVVATHRPDLTRLAELLTALVPQVATVLVVDDGSPHDHAAEVALVAGSAGARAELVAANRGLGAAQNHGVALALAGGATHVLLSDQDSVPGAGMVDALVRGLTRATGAGRRVAAVGPVLRDAAAGGAPMVFGAGRWGPRPVRLPEDPDALVPAAFLFASGCLVPAAAWHEVGPVNEAWFIDQLDVEWGLRAARAGQELLVVVGAGLAHSLGERTRTVPGRRRPVHVHSPAREYYQLRNTVLLVRSGLPPVGWRLGYLGWALRHTALALLLDSRWQRLRYLARGLVDGLRGRTGPVPQGAK